MLPNQFRIFGMFLPPLKCLGKYAGLILKTMLHAFNWIEDINETNLTVRIKKSNSTISLKSADQPDALRGTGINF